MKIEPKKITSPEDFTKQEAAKFLYRLVRDGVLSNQRKRIEMRAELDGAYQANSSAKQEYERLNDMGFGPSYPYSETRLKQMVQHLKDQELETELWKLTLDFVTETFCDTIP